jgi:hypothetical protein
MTNKDEIKQQIFEMESLKGEADEESGDKKSDDSEEEQEVDE